MHDGPISRANIAKVTGLSKQTISEIVEILETEGWVRLAGRTSGHVGRTALTYEVKEDSAFFAVIDLGGTKVKAAIVNLVGDILGTVEEPTDRRGGRNVSNQVAGLCRRAASTNNIFFNKVKLVVAGVPGVPDAETGRVLLAPNIQGIGEFDFRRDLANNLEIPVHLENDVNLAILGEHWLGPGSSDGNLAFISLGMGIGAGIMVEGNLVRGTNGAAGELGYLPIGADLFEPESVKTGALERASATKGIVERYRMLSGKSAAVPEIFLAAEAGDRDAEQVLNQVAKYVAEAVLAVCAIVNPAKVILGGSIGERKEFVERVTPDFTEMRSVSSFRRTIPTWKSRGAGGWSCCGVRKNSLDAVHWRNS